MRDAARSIRKFQTLSTLPSIEANETLYSWCATVHALAGRISSEDTSYALFGNGHSPRQHDIPRGVGALQELLSCFSGDAIELLRVHTVAACYLPFMSLDDQNRLAAEIAGGINPHWRRRLLSASRSYPVQHPLRFCSICCAEDTVKAGRAYWHTQHQLPATWICTQHREPLIILRGRPRRWILPSPALKLSVNAGELDAEVATIAAAVSQAVSTLQVVNSDALRSGALKRLREMGVIYSLAGARHNRIATWFSESALGRMCAHPASGMSALADGTWIPAHLWRKKRDHPAGWIALWGALQWKDSAEACSALIHACTESNLTDGGQYLLFGSSEHMLRAPNQFYAAFEICNSYQEVMSKLQVSRGDVVRWLKADPELRHVWKQGIFNRRLQATLKRLKNSMNDRSIKTLHLEGFIKNNAADTRWLSEHAPHIHQSLIGNLYRRNSNARTLF